MADLRDFLGRVEEGLPFVDPIRHDVMSELGDHLEDAISDLVDRGSPFSDAANQVLRRMGPPEELARSITRAHQTPSRLLAAAGGGMRMAFGATVSGAVFAFFAGLSVALIAFLFVVTVRYQQPWTVAGPAGLAVMFSFAAFVMGQVVPFQVALTSYRPMSWVRPVVGMAIAIALLAFFGLVYRTEMGLWSAVAFTLVPMWGLLGALTVKEEPWAGPRLRSRTFVALAFATAALIVLGVMSEPVIADRFGVPSWRDGFVAESGLSIAGDTTALGQEEVAFNYVRSGTTSFVIVDAAAPLPTYAALTAEVWRARADLAGLDPSRTDPLAKVALTYGSHQGIGGWSATILGMSFVGPGERTVGYSGDLVLSDRRDWGPTWLVLVGTRADGSRDVLRYTIEGDQITFAGSVMEWFLAD